MCQNDITHLAGLKRQRGGIGSSASDSRQQTLGQLWQARKRPKEDHLADESVQVDLVAEDQPTEPYA
jgi:hypothetical protein